MLPVSVKTMAGNKCSMIRSSYLAVAKKQKTALSIEH